MRKRLIAMVGVGMMLLTGCSSTRNKTTTTEDTQATQAKTITEETKQDTTEEVTEAAPKAKEEQTVVDQNDFVAVKKGVHYYEYTEGFNGYITYYEVTDDTHQALADAMNAEMSKRRELFEKECKDISDVATEDAAEGRMDQYEQYSNNVDASIVRDDYAIVSVMRTTESYQGGAHGYTMVDGTTFDVATGKILTLQDLGINKEELIQVILAYIEENGIAEYLYEEYRDTVAEIVNGDMLNWYLDGTGVVAVFNQYDIGPYSSGRFVMELPYEKFAAFKSEYLPVGNKYAKIPDYIDVKMDVTGDGTEDDIYFELVSTDEEMNEVLPALTLNGQKTIFEDYYCFGADAFYMETSDGGNFIVIESSYMNDSRMLAFVDVASGQVVLPDTDDKAKVMYGGIIAMTSKGAMVEEHVDLLGTYCGTRSYLFTKQGMAPVDDRYILDNDAKTEYRRGPITKAEVPCKLEKDGTFSDATLPVGTRIYPINTDSKSVVGFYLEDGTYGEIFFERKDYMITINGIEENELFEELPYAG